MDTLLKQHFWVINLLALALLAWLVAASVNDYLASKLFAIPSVKADTKKAEGTEQVAGSSVGTQVGQDLRSVAGFALPEFSRIYGVRVWELFRVACSRRERVKLE